MDKYEFNIKLEQIKKLAARKDYKAAAAIANSMDWRKMKDWATLATIINVQEAAGYIEEARDTAILAYNRNQGGRRLVYKLTELFIRLGQFEDAEDLYEEYVHMASHDVNRFILEYKLRKAENAPVDTLIEILEEYKSQEIDEKYMYELAQLYSYAGMSDKCVHICDEIILWFSDGEYVDSAIRLKQKYADITATQQKIFEEAVRKKDAPDADQTKELIFAKEHEKIRYSDEMENELEEEYSQDEYEDAEYEDDEEDGYDGAGYEDDEEDDGPAMDLIQNKADENAKNFFRALINKAAMSAKGGSPDDEDGEEEDEEDEETPADTQADNPEYQDSSYVDDAEDADSSGTDDSDSSSGNEGIEKAKQSLNELIAKARQNLEDSYEDVRQEDAEERIAKTAEQIEVPVREYSIYDTRNLQAELAKNLDEIMNSDTAPITPVSPMPSFMNNDFGSVQDEADKDSKNDSDDSDNAADEQIDGQMSIADWVEAVQEEKYGSRETREFSKEELERELAARESKEEAYDRLMAKQKAEAAKTGVPFDEAKARDNANQELMLQSVKTDLAIRTGKAAAHIETDAVKQKEDGRIWLYAYKSKLAKDREEAAAEEQRRVLEQRFSDEEHQRQAQKAMADELAREVREAMDNSAVSQEQDSQKPIPDAEDEEYGEEYDDSYDDEYSEDDYDDEYAEDEYSEDDEYDEDGEYEEDEEYDVEPIEEEEPSGVRALFHFGRKKKSKLVEEEPEEDEYEEEYEGSPDEEEPEYDESEYDDGEEAFELEIPKEVRKFFNKYNDMDGVTEQLAEYFDTVGDEIGRNTSERGNIIISGNRSADKTSLAKNIARALNQLYPEYPKKIAKTTGESINQRGIAKSLPRLIGTVLIVEDAGSIVPKRITELLEVMKQDTGGMIVILIDSDTEINVLLSVNPDLAENFNHRIVIKQYAVAELVDYARKYAGKRQHVVNDDALTLLYMKINKLSKEKEYVRTDEVKEIIDKAIVKAERRASRRLFGRHVRRGGEYFVLTESDFKD